MDTDTQGAVARHRPLVLLAEDNRAVAEGVARILAPGFDMLPVATDGDRLIASALRDRPDIVVTDIAMAGSGGLDAIRAIREAQATMPVLVLTMHTDAATVEAALAAGANGYVLKLAAGDDLAQAIGAVLAGGTFVSPSLSGSPSSAAYAQLR